MPLSLEDMGVSKFYPQGEGVPSRDEIPEMFAALEQETGHDCGSKAFAQRLDELDPLKKLRDCFHMPTLSTLQGVLPEYVAEHGADTEGVYLCGHSLGLQPKAVKAMVGEELRKWQYRAVQSHHDEVEQAWVTLATEMQGDLGTLVGAHVDEVVVMNSLSVNLHVLLGSFYRPTPTRHKILLETKAFPSDHYVALSQVTFHGYDDSALVMVSGGTDEALQVLEKQGDEVALVLLGGIQYYTGLLQDIQAVTAAAHKKGCVVGWDLAHAVGNVVLHLHDWDVDFAAWCSYKYLNSGPGAIGAAFVHEKYHGKPELPRLRGWWGHDLNTRFHMTNEFSAQPGAQAYAMSTPSVIDSICLRASLNVFGQTTMPAVRAKSTTLTAYLEILLAEQLPKGTLNIITPKEPCRRGAQLSLLLGIPVRPVFNFLKERGVIVDMREPQVLRVTPAPLYNTFVDVWCFVQQLKVALAAM